MAQERPGATGENKAQHGINLPEKPGYLGYGSADDCRRYCAQAAGSFSQIIQSKLREAGRTHEAENFGSVIARPSQPISKPVMSSWLSFSYDDQIYGKKVVSEDGVFNLWSERGLVKKGHDLVEYMCFLRTAQTAYVTAVEKTEERLAGIQEFRVQKETDVRLLKSMTVHVNTTADDLLEFAGSIEKMAELRAQEIGLDRDQKRLLADLAFIRKTGLLEKGAYSVLVSPLVDFIAQGEWENAYDYRNFLLGNFPLMFSKACNWTSDSTPVSVNEFMLNNPAGSNVWNGISETVRQQMEKFCRTEKKTSEKKTGAIRIEKPVEFGSGVEAVETVEKTFVTDLATNVLKSVGGKNFDPDKKINGGNAIVLPTVLVGEVKPGLICKAIGIRPEKGKMMVLFNQGEKGCRASEIQTYEMELVDVLMELKNRGFLSADLFVYALQSMEMKDSCPSQLSGKLLAEIMEKAVGEDFSASRISEKQKKFFGEIIREMANKGVVV